MVSTVMMAASALFPTCCLRASWNPRSTQQRTSQAPTLDSCLHLELVAPLFSYSYELLFLQFLSFDNHPHCPGVSPSNRWDFGPESSLWFSDFVASPLFSSTCGLFFSLVVLFRSPVLCFQQLARSLAKTPGGMGELSFPSLTSSASFTSLFTMLKSIRHRYEHS